MVADGLIVEVVGCLEFVAEFVVESESFFIVVEDVELNLGDISVEKKQFELMKGLLAEAVALMRFFEVESVQVCGVVCEGVD